MEKSFCSFFFLSFSLSRSFLLWIPFSFVNIRHSLFAYSLVWSIISFGWIPFSYFVIFHLATTYSAFGGFRSILETPWYSVTKISVGVNLCYDSTAIVAFSLFPSFYAFKKDFFIYLLCHFCVAHFILSHANSGSSFFYFFTFWFAESGLLKHL